MRKENKFLEGINPENAPNEEYLELNFVGETATGKGNNQRYTMENNHDGTFTGTYSRVGITIGRNAPKKHIWPIEEWQNKYHEKAFAHGYILTKTAKMDIITVDKNGTMVNGSVFEPIKDESVREIVDRLLLYANTVIEQNYTIKVEAITDEMLTLGQSVLVDLSNQYEILSVASFNSKLKVLFAVIPRRMDNVSKHLAKRQSEYATIISEEQYLFDIMKSQVKNSDKTSDVKNPTLLDVQGLEWSEVTEEKELKEIRIKLGQNASQLVKAWRINNKETESRFDQFLKTRGLTGKEGITELFHGSRHENFWSIITNGLMLSPVNVVITGKMYGNGIYFAPKAQKSLGYTSRYGSHWTNGNASTGFLAIYQVATGTTFNTTDHKSEYSSLTYSGLQKLQKGADCFWAHGGSALRNDEVIIYKEEQCTIKYLLEMSV